MACDAVGDHEHAALARKVTLAAILPAAPLLVLDLGRPLRFLNMMRIFKVRSPMSMGAWCLSGVLDGRGRRRRRRPARTPAARAAARRQHRRPRHLPRLVHRRPARVDGRAAVGAQPRLAAADLHLHRDGGRRRGQPPRGWRPPGRRPGTRRVGRSAWSRPRRWPPSSCCRRSTSVASGPLAHALEEGRPGAMHRFATWAVRGGLALRLARRSAADRAWITSRACSSCSRGSRSVFAWVGAGRTSAHDHEAVALTARRKVTAASRH